MPNSIVPILKQSLADNLAQEIKKFIIGQRYNPGDRLPSTTELANRFGVGLPTLREGLKKLEAVGAVQSRHGSGIYVGEHINSLILQNPITLPESPTKKQLLDLIEARIAIEPKTAALAAVNARPEQLDTMQQLLDAALINIDNNNILNEKNMLFHKEIANASANSVFSQILGVLAGLFRGEQQMLIDIYRSKESDHQQHVEIFEAIKNRNSDLSEALMQNHLEGVREAIVRWNPATEDRHEKR